MFKRDKRKLILVLIFVILLAALGITIITAFSIKKVTITGNEHYTEEEIKNLIFTNRKCNNSLYLSWKYNYEKEYSIPFVDTIEVNMVSRNEVKINVYEKSVVGYIEYLGSYLYFDKDGIVVESSTDALLGVPQITGLKFDHILLYNKLPVVEDKVFNTIVSITQLLSKYEIAPDRINFDSNYEMTLYFSDARVYLGKDDNTEEKINRLRGILPDLEGLSGVLHMETYQEGMSNITFEKDK